jgi:hypothetical protein
MTIQGLNTPIKFDYSFRLFRLNPGHLKNPDHFKVDIKASVDKVLVSSMVKNINQ